MFLGNFGIRQCTCSFYNALGIIPFLFLLVGQFIYLSTNPGVYVHPRNLLQNLRFLVIFTVQESCELALGKHRCTAELIEIQTYCSSDFISNLSVFGQSALCVEVLQFPCFCLDGTTYPFVGTGHSPCGFITHAVAANECERDVSLGGIATHQLARIIDLDLFLGIHRYALHLRAVQTWCISIKSQADGIENGGLASSCFTSY